MSKDEIISQQKNYVFCFYLEKFCSENKTRLKGVFFNQMFDVIFNDKKLLVEFLFFMSDKMYLLTFRKEEVAKLQELFKSDLN